MRYRFVILAVAATCASAPPADASSQFVAGPWRGQALFKDAKFTHCSMRARFGAWRLFVSKHPNGALTLGVFNKGMNFTKGNRLNGSLQFDTVTLAHTFLAVRKDTVGARLGADSVQRFAQAGRLRFRLGDFATEFQLMRTRDALASLSACVAKGKP